ncbi:TonB-dependent receptor [Permianibacter sp. IMCC34836]|uniref:TonB-dependent receptor plug domain-containing protein n=1 Tax=Permianibacter fluminis TaxID=2738515 RepID=UPI001553BD78|nr:TonB-dependent receptor [Permianibacter fluminis]NQD38729.1 TonB-dependent receptor [Permianibacter fluminis]
MSTLRNNPLAKAIRFALIGGAAVAAISPVFAADEEGKEDEQRIEVTGSRIKRSDVEGALPVTVIDREAIDMSGDVSVAEVLRNSTFNSFGSYRPQSGSSFGSAATVSLRGLGSDRTLVLVDGRRTSKSPLIGSSSDLNSIPLAAVERIEILSDGASAVYGSDAIGGVVNIITRKDFNGVEFRFGEGRPTAEGGDTEESSMVFGISGDKGNMIAGVSKNQRDIVFQRDREWSKGGASTFGNNWREILPSGAEGAYRGSVNTIAECNAMPGFSHNEQVGDNSRCLYDFTFVAADEAEVDTTAAFVKGRYEINDDWSIYANTSVTRIGSFGRYAPAPSVLFVEASNPFNPFGRDMYVRHRYAALGNRDDKGDANVYDLLVGVEGTIGAVSIDAGIRRNDFQSYSIGNGYVVDNLAAQAVAAGDYNFVNPYSNDAVTLAGMKATTLRDSFFKTNEAYVNASFDLFEMAGGTASMVVGVETRNEDYQDRYDSLQEGGQIGGSAGNSAGKDRDVDAGYFEVLLPLFDKFELDIAGRYDKYSDYGSDTAPKVSVRYQVLEELTLRASYGEGFRAPSLPQISQARSYSADFVNDPATCVFSGLIFDFNQNRCENNAGVAQALQVDAYSEANPELSSEQSKQFSIGVAWEPTDWLNMTADYWDIKLTDRIASFDTAALVDRIRAGLALPAGLSIERLDVQGCDVNGNPVATGPDGVINDCDPIVQGNTGSANSGDIHMNGLDISLNTKFDFGAAGRLENLLNINWSKTLEVDGGENLIGFVSGDTAYPEYRGLLANQYYFSDFMFSWNINYISDLPGLGDDGEETQPDWVTHDVQVSWNAPWNGQIVVGVTNVTDEEPNLSDNASRGFNFDLYDGYGKVTYFRYSQTF